MSILVIVEHDNSTVFPSTLNTTTAAVEIASHTQGKIDLVVVGSDCGAVAEQCSKIPGIETVKLVDASQHKDQIAENMSQQIAELAADYTHILAPASTFGKNFMPRVAAMLDVAQISDISDVISGDTFIRPIYAGNALAKVQSSDATKIITVRTTRFEVCSAEGGNASIETVDAVEDQGLSQFVERKISESDRPELTSAKTIISGGRGMQDGSNFEMLNAVADKLGAAVGASRAAVDAGYVPNDYQVGQTGKVVAPDLYIAVGISGAIQHLAGMKDSKVIVAINKDSEAPIFQIADYGLVADLFEAIPELTAALD